MCAVGPAVEGETVGVINKVAIAAGVRGMSRILCTMEGCELRTLMVDNDPWGSDYQTGGTSFEVAMWQLRLWEGAVLPSLTQAPSQLPSRRWYCIARFASYTCMSQLITTF